MANKTQVIGSALTTTESALDSLTLILVGNISADEVGTYKQKIERLGRTIDKLTGMMDDNINYGVLQPQMGSIKSKYQILAEKVTLSV